MPGREDPCLSIAAAWYHYHSSCGGPATDHTPMCWRSLSSSPFASLFWTRWNLCIFYTTTNLYLIKKTGHIPFAVAIQSPPLLSLRPSKSLTNQPPPKYLATLPSITYLSDGIDYSHNFFIYTTIKFYLKKITSPSSSIFFEQGKTLAIFSYATMKLY